MDEQISEIALTKQASEDEIERMELFAIQFNILQRK